VRRYKAHSAGFDVAVGDEFDGDFSAEEEAELLGAGRIEILPEEYEVVGSSRVQETNPGDTFMSPLPLELEAILVEGGHIVKATTKKATGKDAEVEKEES
jgi:hypothetical protein